MTLEIQASGDLYIQRANSDNYGACIDASSWHVRHFIMSCTNIAKLILALYALMVLKVTT